MRLGFAKLSRLCKHGKKSSIAFIKYFSTIIRQMKENAGFFYFLIETDFFDKRSYFLTANQNTRLTKIRVMSQPYLHTLI